MFQDGLELLLKRLDPETDITKVSCLSKSESEIQGRLDLILFDIMLPNRTVEEGFSALRVLHQKMLKTPIIVVTALCERGCVSRALEAGARAYIPKSFTSEIILSAIRLVLSGGVYVPPELFDPITNVPIQRIPSAEADTKDKRLSLTRRQRDVLSLLSQGYSNKEIGLALGVAEGTIKIHVAAIFKVLSVTNRTQAVIAANRLGIITDERPAAELNT